MLPIGTKVRVKLDVNKDIIGKKLIGWKSGKVTNVNDQLNIYDPIEYNTIQLNNNIIQPEQQTFNKYDIFIIEEPINSNMVGASYDSLNNCFIFSISFKISFFVKFCFSTLI